MTVTAPAQRLRDRALLPVAVVCLSLVQLVHGDVGEAAWMAREGGDVWRGSPLVHPDHWSWQPQPWDFLPTSPAWQFVSLAAWSLLGVFGLHLLAAMTTAVCLSVIAVLARSLGASRSTTVVALGLVYVSSIGALSARAGLPAFLLLLLALRIIDAEARRANVGDEARLGATVLVVDFAVAYAGSWLHQSWATFSIALGALQVLLLARASVRRRARMITSCAGFAAAVAGAALGPLGWQAWPASLQLAAACRGIVSEWKSPWSLGSPWPQLWALLVILAMVTALQWWRHRQQTSALELVLLVIAAACMVAGLDAVRFLTLGACALAPALAAGMSRTWGVDRLTRLRVRLGERAAEEYWRTVLALLLAPALALAVWQARLVPTSPDPSFTALPADCRLYSTDAVAKLVELYRPDVRVWIDGRQHYWGRERLLLSRNYRNGRPAHVPTGTTCVMLERESALALHSTMNSSSAWELVAETGAYSVWRTVEPPI